MKDHPLRLNQMLTKRGFQVVTGREWDKTRSEWYNSALNIRVIRDRALGTTCLRISDSDGKTVIDLENEDSVQRVKDWISQLSIKGPKATKPVGKEEGNIMTEQQLFLLKHDIASAATRLQHVENMRFSDMDGAFKIMSEVKHTLLDLAYKTLAEKEPIAMTLQTSLERIQRVCRTYDDCDIEVEVLEEDGSSLVTKVLSDSKGLNYMVDTYPDHAMIITIYQDDDIIDQFEF